MKILRTCARESSICRQLVELECPFSLAQMLSDQPIEVRVLSKSLIARLIPYCDSQTDYLLESILLEEDEVSFVLHTLVKSCELMDPCAKSIKVLRLVDMIRDLVAAPANLKSLLDNGAQEILLELAQHDSHLKEAVISSFSPRSIDTASETCTPSTESLLGETQNIQIVVGETIVSSSIENLCFPSDDGTVELIHGVLLQLNKCVRILCSKSSERNSNEALIVQAMTLSNMLLNVAIAQCDSNWQGPIGDYIAAQTPFVEDLCNLLNICYTRTFSSSEFFSFYR